MNQHVQSAGGSLGPLGGAPVGGPGGFGLPAAVPDPELQKKINLWFTLSIVSVFCGCGLLGIVPIIIATNAKKAYAAGDSARAEQDIAAAKLLCLLCYSFLGLCIVAVVILAAVRAFDHVF